MSSIFYHVLKSLQLRMTGIRNDLLKAMMATALALLITVAGIFTLLPHHLHHASLHHLCFAQSSFGHSDDATSCGGADSHGLDVDGCGYRQPALRVDSQQHNVPEVSVVPAMAVCSLASIPRVAETELQAMPHGERPSVMPMTPSVATCGLRAPPAGNDF